jgi:uncharacterized protein YjbI with pentapeptide repeats
MRESFTEPADGAFFGRYILSTYQGSAQQPSGWIVVGADGNLEFVTDAFPLDGSGLFDSYWVSSSGAFAAGIQFKSVSNGKYLAAKVQNSTPITATADTAVEALRFFPSQGWPPAYFAAQLLAMQPGDPNAYPLWSLQQMPLLVVQATPASFIAQPLITMTLVEPGTLPVVAPSSPVAVTKLGSGPALPYFAGKYVLCSPADWVNVMNQSGGWIVRGTDGAAAIANQAFPNDGSGFFIAYFQTSSSGCLQAGNATGQFLTLALQTMITMGPATITSAPSADFTQLGSFFALGFVTPDDTTMTRVVPGLQEMLAPGALHWWDGADLSYVDMRTCVGSLTGAAAQWGDANLTGALLTGMDLGAINIGNKVNFTGASLAKVKFGKGQDLGSANFTGADLSRVDLSAVILKSATLDGAKLTDCKIAGVDLSQASCARTDFSNLDLTGTTLPLAAGAMGQGVADNGAIFVAATVPVAALGADWRNLDLSTTAFTPAAGVTAPAVDAGGVDLHETVLDGLTFATVTQDTITTGASFHFADLTSASLRGTSLKSADFSSAVLYAANLSNADLTSTVWSNAFLGTKQLLFTLSPYAPGDTATLNGGAVPPDLATAFASNGHKLQSPDVKTRSNSSAWTITDGGSVYSVVASKNSFDVLTSGRTSAQLSGALMENADLTGGSFAGVHFSGVQLIGAGATAAGVDFEQADFSGANLSSATPGYPDLSGALLYGVHFDGAFLFNANLGNAYLSPSSDSMPAVLRNAMLAAATLTGAQLDGADMTGALIGLSPQGAPTAFAGVPLFTLDAATFKPILNDGAGWGPTAPAPLQDAFARNNVPLAAPVVWQGFAGQAQWSIVSASDNNLDPPPAPTASNLAWTTFMIMQGDPAIQGTGDLIVYGMWVWMFAPDPGGVLQSNVFIVAPTVWTQTDLAATTYCPNSRTWETNLANKIPWEAAMIPAPPGQVTPASR